MKRFWLYGLLGVFLVGGLGLFMTRDAWFDRRSSSDANRLTIAVTGDTESNLNVLERSVAIARKRGASFLLHTGDLTETGTTAEIEAAISVFRAGQLPFAVSLGNHELRTDSSGSNFDRLVNPRNTAVEIGGYRLLVLDNADRLVGFSDQTLAWLDKELADHPTDRYLVAFHRPFDLPLQAIIGDDETPTSRASNTAALERLRRVNVLGYFTGHLHLYLPFTLDGVPAYVTGGGGAEAQTALGSIGDQGDHLLLVHLEGDDLSVEYVRLDSSNR